MRWLTLIVPALLFAVTAAPAAAQLPVPGLPIPPPTGSPTPPPNPNPGNPPQQGPAPSPNGPTAAPGEVVAEYGDVAGDGNAADASVFGPLEAVWSKSLGGGARQPLIVGGKLVVAEGEDEDKGVSLVVAYDPHTGAEAWRQTVLNITGLAANGGRVFAIGNDNQLRAFDVATGAPAWTAQLSNYADPGVPVAAGGSVFVTEPLSDSDHEKTVVYAFAVDSGAQRWKTEIPLPPNGDGHPVLDDKNLYITGDSGAAYALAQTTGQIVWKPPDNTFAGYGARGVIAGGRVYTPKFSFDLASGQSAPWQGTPQAATADTAFNVSGGNDAGPLTMTARRLSDGASLWKFETTNATYLGQNAFPLVAGPTVFTAGEKQIYGLDRTTGKLLAASPIPKSAQTFDGTATLIASGGLLFMANKEHLTAFEPVLRPAEKGADVAASRYYSTAGQRVSLVGGIKPELRGHDAKMKLGFDNFPDGKFGVGATGNLQADGTTYFSARPARNVRYRVSSAGATSRSLRVYVYPSQSWKVRATSRTRGLISIRLKAGRDYRPGGKTLVVYLGRNAKKRFERLGSARVRATGRGRGRADVGFRLVKHVGAKDSLVYCVQGQAKAGWGLYDHFERDCGRARIKF